MKEINSYICKSRASRKEIDEKFCLSVAALDQLDDINDKTKWALYIVRESNRADPPFGEYYHDYYLKMKEFYIKKWYEWLIHPDARKDIQRNGDPSLTGKKVTSCTKIIN